MEHERDEFVKSEIMRRFFQVENTVTRDHVRINEHLKWADATSKKRDEQVHEMEVRMKEIEKERAGRIWWLVTIFLIPLIGGVGSYAVVKYKIEENIGKIVSGESSIKDHDTRIVRLEKTSEDLKETTKEIQTDLKLILRKLGQLETLIKE